MRITKTFERDLLDREAAVVQYAPNRNTSDFERFTNNLRKLVENKTAMLIDWMHETTDTLNWNRYENVWTAFGPVRSYHSCLGTEDKMFSEYLMINVRFDIRPNHIEEDINKAIERIKKVQEMLSALNILHNKDVKDRPR